MNDPVSRRIPIVSVQRIDPGLIELKSLPQKVEMILFWLGRREEKLSKFIAMF